ncbi:MAG: cytochrome c peroxidase [Ardenticatenaceae bacterium]
MNRSVALALVGLLAVILFAARVRASQVEGQINADLQVRVRPGEGAQVPPELAAMMQEWPEQGEPPSPAEIELGRLLFFDPILSGNNEVSCATCHHPDMGFGDGLAQAIGVSGVPLPRSAPSLWNVSLRSHFTWDGRAETLESQMLDGPIFHPDEMAEEPGRLLAELENNEEYARLFEESYGEVSLENVARAIAAFERTLISRNSPFDRYAAGDYYALTGAQRRGFEVFRGPETNCVKCHELPTFRTDEFKVIGVRDEAGEFDPGRGGITDREADIGAFAVPTLRNIALSAPYMHNGIEPALNGAISFYLNGGGDNLHIPRSRLDPDLQSFNVSTRDLEDLEAFLLSLTDESAVPAIPEEVPSSFAPVAPRSNPAREQIEESSALPPGEPRTHRVAANDSIQAAIDIARPGDTIVIEPGRYFETLDVDVEKLTIRGVGATLVGRRFTPTSIVIRNNDVTLVGLSIEQFGAYTIDVQGAHGTHLESVTLNGTTVSGLLEELARQ